MIKRQSSPSWKCRPSSTPKDLEEEKTRLSSRSTEMGEEVLEDAHFSIRIEEDNHVSGENNELFQRIRQKINPIPSSQCFIYRIPECLRILSEDAYVPKILSIGPFHRDKECVKAMEEHKKWYLHALIYRTPAPDNCLKDFLKAIQAMEAQIRASYAEPIDLCSDEFVEMMLLDACFIIELFYNYGRVELREDNDPIYITSWMLRSLKHDIILLENQLPFFVLEQLFDKIRDPDNGDLFLEEYVQYFFRDVLPPVENASKSSRRQSNHLQDRSSLRRNHLLDLLRNHVFQFKGQMEVVDYAYGEQLIESATELANAGMIFEPEHIADSLLEISLNKKGVFRIPLFYLDDTVSYLLGNLIALEQCDSDYTSLVSSYIVLLDGLISSPKDVRLLRQEAILDSFFRDDEQVFLIIKKLSKGVIFSKFCFADVCQQVNAYYNTDWRKWKAHLKRNYVHTLRRDYFNTPWAFISFVAATLLLLFTFAQTILSALS